MSILRLTLYYPGHLKIPSLSSRTISLITCFASTRPLPRCTLLQLRDSGLFGRACFSSFDGCGIHFIVLGTGVESLVQLPAELLHWVRVVAVVVRKSCTTIAYSSTISDHFLRQCVRLFGQHTGAMFIRLCRILQSPLLLIPTYMRL